MQCCLFCLLVRSASCAPDDLVGDTDGGDGDGVAVVAGGVWFACVLSTVVQINFLFGSSFVDFDCVDDFVVARA